MATFYINNSQQYQNISNYEYSHFYDTDIVPQNYLSDITNKKRSHNRFIYGSLIDSTSKPNAENDPSVPPSDHSTYIQLVNFVINKSISYKGFNN